MILLTRSLICDRPSHLASTRLVSSFCLSMTACMLLVADGTYSLRPRGAVAALMARAAGACAQRRVARGITANADGGVRTCFGLLAVGLLKPPVRVGDHLAVKGLAEIGAVHVWVLFGLDRQPTGTCACMYAKLCARVRTRSVCGEISARAALCVATGAVRGVRLVRLFKLAAHAEGVDRETLFD